MRALAARFGEDGELWGVTGLVHDLDLDECEGDPESHALVGARILEQHGAPDVMVQAVLGHNDKAPRETRLAKALWVVDPTTGFITASALIRPSRSTRDLDVKSIRKRMKDKRFAAAVSRDQIQACGEQLGIELDAFLALCLEAMDGIRDHIGLGGGDGKEA
jgi:predicted hydrolase (HD superfamily)